MRAGWIAGSLAVLLAGCDTSEPPEANAMENAVAAGDAEVVVPAPRESATPAEAPPLLNLAPDGLTIVLGDGGTSRQAGFGLPRGTAIQMVGAALGNPIEQGENPECGAGPLVFANFRGGLTLYFQDDKFAGWDLDGRDGAQYSTAAGIGIGSTRSQIEQATELTVEETSIGHEFHAGDMSGLLSSPGPDGKVTNVWAGVTCIFR